MDNGHTAQSTNVHREEQPFFTPGQGNEPEQANNFESENNLNTSTWSEPSEHDIRNVGNHAIASTEIDQSPMNTTETAGMGEVITLSMPPTTETIQVEDANKPSDSLDSQSSDVNLDQIKTGETLSDAGIRRVEEVTKDFEETGDASTFYQSVCDLIEVNMTNSYGENSALKEVA